MRKLGILGERHVRDKHEVTLPIPVRQFLNLKPGDIVRFISHDGNICMKKVVTRIVNNKFGGEDESNERKVGDTK